MKHKNNKEKNIRYKTKIELNILAFKRMQLRISLRDEEKIRNIIF